MSRRQVSLLAESGTCADAREDGTNVAYFRGRKLNGKVVKLPEPYQGVLLEKRTLVADEDSKHAAEEDEAKAGGMHTLAKFDEVIIWGHEATADASSDPYIRGLDEWISVADQVCSHSSLGSTQAQASPQIHSYDASNKN